MSPSPNPHDLLRNLRVNTPVFDRAGKVQDYLVQSSESPIGTNGALARSLVSGGVVNRSVVNQEQHVRLVASNAKKNGERGTKCAGVKISP